MHQGSQEKPRKKPRILLAPLDWGLGHTTRCIPIISELLRNNCDVWLAGDETQKVLFGCEFPALPFLNLPGYKVQYANTAAGLFWKILFQLPKIFFAARQENTWIKRTLK